MVICPSKHSLLCLAAILWLGCSGGSDSPTEPSPPEVEGASLAVTEAQNFERVDVLGLAAPSAAKVEIGDYRARVSADGSEDFELILDHDETGWYFHAPLNPVDPLAPGRVEIRITDGEHASDPQDLEFGTLSPSPGSFASLVATIHEYLEQRAGWAGTSLEELRSADSTQLAPALLPLKLAQEYLDSENDANDLTDLVANADDFLSAQEVELLDRIYGAFELEALLRADIEAADGLDPIPAPPAGSRTAGKLCFDGGPEDIDSAPLLSIYMTRSAVAAFGADPNSTAGRTLGAGATMLTGLSNLPGPPGKTAAVAGVVFAAVDGITAAVAGLLPSQFESIRFEVSPTSFNEDSEEHATYDNVKVKASSTGWVADRSLANAIINAVGAYMTVAEKLEIAGDGILRNTSVIGIGVGADDLFGETDILEFCSQTWEVDISSPQYCTAAALDRRFDVDIPQKKVTPADVGVDVLEVAAQSTQFGGREISDTVPMEVHAIQVQVTPEDKYIETPGETIEITAQIEHADLETLRWTAERGSWEDGLMDETNGGRARPLKTPTDPEAYPFTVTAESISDKGLRADGEPPRRDSMVVRYEGGIRIEPQFVCISPGETQQFEAIVAGQQDYTVIWELGPNSYGSIDQNGLYTSLPQGSSNADVIARIEGIEGAEDTARVEVGACNCSLEVAIDGASTWRRNSAQAAYSINVFDTVIYQFWFNADADDDFPIISANLAGTAERPAPVPGDDDTNWPVSFVYGDGTTSWTAAQEDELAGVTLHIDTITETEMVGTMKGSAVIRDGDTVVSTVIVDVKFRAGLWDGGWPCE